MFSKACEYGIRATIFVAKQSIEGRKVSLKETTKAIDSPEAYTSKILQQLKKHEIIRSDKGPRGGFSMEKEKLEKTTLEEIVYCFDGDSIYQGCGLGLKACNANKPCPIHFEFAKVRDGLAELLSNTRIITLANEINDGLAFLKS
ncbi:MAG: transcriptional regulator [Flavobacteriales bacterium]|nr:transcriptional regulator [Flavobacteriales bacterium]